MKPEVPPPAPKEPKENDPKHEVLVSLLKIITSIAWSSVYCGWSLVKPFFVNRIMSKVAEIFLEIHENLKY